MSVIVNNSTNNTTPDTLLGLADPTTEVVIIMGVIVLVIGILFLLAWNQRRGLRTKQEKKK